MSLTILSSELACFDVFLGIVPGTSSVVEEECHQDTCACSKHEESSKSFCSKKRSTSERTNYSKDHSDGDGREDCEQAWLHHLLKTGGVDDSYALLVVWLLLVGADAGMLLKLSSYFLNDRFGCDTDGSNSPGTEYKDSH